jgi:type III restriction enzyme
MEIRFEGDQEYQLDAIGAVVQLFEGQPLLETEFVLSEGGIGAIANELDLSDDDLLANVRSVQEENDLPSDDELAPIEQQIEAATGDESARWFNFSVEMETGTGKTYVYIRTALELYQRYGMRKFIIVVPSVAIREGVLKTLRMTEQHLRDLYGNPPYRYYAYSSDTLNVVRQFALSDGIELMVMTIDSFNKASNIIRQPTDRLQGETPLHLIQATRPILILDEPQNMETELRVDALSHLNPLLALRYSATHRNPYCLIYRLTPADAYRQQLVKQIDVAGVEREADANQVFLRLDSISAGKRTVSAKLAIHKLMAGGVVREKVVTVRNGDRLVDKATRPEYEGFDVDEIIPDYGIRFTNDIEVRLGEARGADREAIFEAQIRYTVEEHLRKQARLKEAGLKVLSLFFIDRVANYTDDEGLIRVLFDKAFTDLRDRFPEWKGRAPEEVRSAYFAEKRRRSGDVEAFDSSGRAVEDERAYDLIMRDKEQLLSFDEPVAFIFSHSALREGWDNPNIFQICTLNQTRSEVRKRQEIGRGVRLPVNQAGDRVRDPALNVLTVVANESYEQYVSTLQAEITDEFGADGLPPKPGNARQRGTARLVKAHQLKPEFQELWNRIKHKTRYAVAIDSDRIVNDVVPELDRLTIKPLRVTLRKGRVRVSADDLFGAQQVAATRTAMELGPAVLPNVVDLVTHLLEHSAPPIRLTRETLAEIFRRCSNRRAALANPHEWAMLASRVIREKLADQLVDGIKYEKLNEWYELTQFQLEILAWEQYLIPADRSLYDHVVFDSDVEKKFVQDLEQREDVKLYIKLPNWFKVPTPVGEYNPDWAIVVESVDEAGLPKETVYLVAETKGHTERGKLRPSEQRKIDCAERHFEDALGVDYRVVKAASDV